MKYQFRRGISLVLVLLISSSSALQSGEFSQSKGLLNPSFADESRQDIWDLTNGGDKVVDSDFSHSSYSDYSDVGVLINNNSETSKTIGYAFVTARNISMERVFLFNDTQTPTTETINPNQFDTYFATPLANMLSDRNLTLTLNYLVTTKGIPLRVNGPSNERASFDQEIGLVGGRYAANIHQNWWFLHDYGPWGSQGMEEFTREKYGFYLVSRLTGYDVDTALGLIEKANNSFGSRGQFVMDLATNRNGSGYKSWNDMLYLANTSLNEMGESVHFNQNSTFVTNESNVMGYSSWGSNDGAWGYNWLPNSGFDTAGTATTGARYWEGTLPPLTGTEAFEWSRNTDVSRNGAASVEGVLESGICTTTAGGSSNGLFAEYFDNDGITFNISLMPNLSGRAPDFSRIEGNIDWLTTGDAWSGLGEAFKDYWAVRHTGFLHIPESGNWTFYLQSDDGSRLWLDELLIVDNPGEHASQEASGMTYLEEGEYPLRTEMFEHGGVAGFHLLWEGPNVGKQVIPQTALTIGPINPVQEESLIHWWPFDEGIGNTAEDVVGGANMTFHTGNNTSWDSCLVGSCHRYDGVDDMASVDVSDWGGNFSVSLWVKANVSGQPIHASVFAVNEVGGDNGSFQIQTSGTTPGEWQVYHNISYDFGQVEEGEWTHLAVTFQNNTLVQYMDGSRIATTVVPSGSIDSIELYKIGANRANDTFFDGWVDEVKVWNETLNDIEIRHLHQEVAFDCPEYSHAVGGEASIEQQYNFDPDLVGHAWILYGYAQKDGWLNGDWRLEIDGLDVNGTILSTNTSSTNTFADSWNSRTVRFRPHQDAVSFKIRAIATFENHTRNGSIFFDTFNLRAIRPHFGWVDGSIADTAVSTGGRSFTIGTSYGQSLVVDLLEDGVSSVKGYVYEPYLTAISQPHLLHPIYASGFNMAESFYAANGMLSWMGVVVGDPKMSSFADRLHDINVIDARANQTLSEGLEGEIEVLVENRGPGLAVGYIEVRNRQGGTLMANLSITLPPGDEAGSRAIFTVNLTPDRTGWTDYQIRYVASNESYPQRVTSNDLHIHSVEINAAPEVVSGWCDVTEAKRGDRIGCTAVATDDVGVSAVQFAWRASNSSDNWVWTNAYHSEGDEWRGFIQLPPDMETGLIDLLIAAVDEVNVGATSLFISEIIMVNDVPAIWYGIHVEGADISNWFGTTNLPPIAPFGVERGNTLLLRSCVLESDHVLEDAPSFNVSRGVVDNPVPEEYIGGGVYCYWANWSIPVGGDLEPASVTLRDASGQVLNMRQVNFNDLPPSVSVELLSNLGSPTTLVRLENESLRVTVTDLDDPLGGASVTVGVTWPGGVLIESTHIIPAGKTNITLPLPLPTEALELGILQVTVDAESAHSAKGHAENGWPLHLQPPSLRGPVICWEQEIADEFGKGMTIEAIIWVIEERPLSSLTVSLKQGPWSSTGVNVTPQGYNNSQIPAGCLGSTGIDDQWIPTLWELSVGPEFQPGGAMLIGEARDIDGLITKSQTSLNMTLMPPVVVVNGMPDELKSGDVVQLQIEIKDLDDTSWLTCEIRFEDENHNLLFHTIISTPPTSTEDVGWFISSGVGNHTLTVMCTDSDGQIGSFIVDKLEVESQGNGGGSESNEPVNQNPAGLLENNRILLGGGLVILILLLAVFMLTRWRKEREGIWQVEEPHFNTSKAIVQQTPQEFQATEVVEELTIDSQATQPLMDQRVEPAQILHDKAALNPNSQQEGEQDLDTLLSSFMSEQPAPATPVQNGSHPSANAILSQSVQSQISQTSELDDLLDGLM